MALAVRKSESIRLPADRLGFSPAAWEQFGISSQGSQSIALREEEPRGTQYSRGARSRKSLEGQVRDLSLSFEQRILFAHWQMKVTLARFAMYLTNDELRRFHIHLDRLVAVKTWPEDEEMADAASFAAFLRWHLWKKWESWTALGFSPSGRILVSWSPNGAQVTGEFFKDDQVRWTVRFKRGERQSIAAGTVDIQDFPNVISGMIRPAREL